MLGHFMVYTKRSSLLKSVNCPNPVDMSIGIYMYWVYFDVIFTVTDSIFNVI